MQPYKTSRWVLILQYYYSFLGVSLDTKMAAFGVQLVHDTRWGLWAMIAVILVVWLHSASLIYTLAVLVLLVLSAGASFFVYSVLLGIHFFPFINVLVVVLLLGIGSDDAFILNFAFTRLQRGSGGMSAALVHDALAHAARTMFVTSATSAVAFYATALSDVIVIR